MKNRRRGAAAEIVGKPFVMPTSVAEGLGIVGTPAGGLYRGRVKASWPAGLACIFALVPYQAFCVVLIFFMYIQSTGVDSSGVFADLACSFKRHAQHAAAWSPPACTSASARNFVFEFLGPAREAITLQQSEQPQSTSTWSTSNVACVVHFKSPASPQARTLLSPPQCSKSTGERQVAPWLRRGGYSGRLPAILL